MFLAISQVFLQKSLAILAKSEYNRPLVSECSYEPLAILVQNNPKRERIFYRENHNDIALDTVVDGWYDRLSYETTNTLNADKITSSISTMYRNVRLRYGSTNLNNLMM